MAHGILTRSSTGSGVTKPSLWLASGYSSTTECNLGWCSSAPGVHPKCHAFRLAHCCARGLCASASHFDFNWVRVPRASSLVVACRPRRRVQGSLWKGPRHPATRSRRASRDLPWCPVGCNHICPVPRFFMGRAVVCFCPSVSKIARMYPNVPECIANVLSLIHI